MKPKLSSCIDYISNKSLIQIAPLIITPLHYLINLSLDSGRAERDFGLETETETWVVSVSVSSLETTYSKSRYQSQFLRP